MSDDEGPKPPPQRPFHIVRDETQQRSGPHKINEAQAKQLFMASNHLEWSTWSKSMGWNPRANIYPDFGAWSKEKKEILARDQAESISEALFSSQGRWHQDVLKTLKEYPEASDAMMGILKRRVNDIIAVINDDDRQKQIHMQSGTMEQFSPNFKSIDNGELAKLASAIRITTDTKHRALMIDRWSIRGAEQYTDPKQFEQAEQHDASWNVTLYNNQKMAANDLRDMMHSYYDQPKTTTIDAETGDGEMETT